MSQVTEWNVPEEIPTLKTKSNFHTIGQPKARVDFLSKLTGQAVYGYDARVEGMLYGAIARPLTIEGKLTTAEPSDAPNRPGVVQVIIEEGFAGVVAESRAAARDGVNNSFMDELAHAAQMDPLAFRLQQLPEGELGERYQDVLTATAEKAGWGKPLPTGRARGLACCVDARTVVAHIAEVSVENGQIRVHKVTAGIDPGLIINPDGAAAQTEGNIVMGLSSTLFEQVMVKNGIIEPANFDLYPLITMKETPAIEVVLRESGETPYGLGEPPMGPIAAAVGNAVFALTGQRLRQMPLSLRE